MPYYKFKENTIFNNTLETFPEVQFDINSNKVYLNNVNERSGAFVNNVGMVPVGNLNLYEMNVDRPSDSMVYPFVTKGGSFDAMGNVSAKDYFSSFEYGDILSGFLSPVCFFKTRALCSEPWDTLSLRGPTFWHCVKH